MGFLERAKGAAREAASAIDEAATRATDPAHGERVRAGLSAAATSARSVLDRVDPGAFADMIIKATALQERVNANLRAKDSVYRIGELSVTAAIPPSITFAIVRVADEGGRPSSELVPRAAPGAGDGPGSGDGPGDDLLEGAEA